jgi:hypothetical protein
MARLSLYFLLLLSLLSLSLARFVHQPDNLLPEPGTESESSFLPQLPKPEFESESETVSLSEVPNPEQEEKREIPELPNPELEEKPEIAETVQYIVVPVHRFQDVHDFENLRDIGFSLRLPMRHGHHHHHHHHRFGGFGHRFDHRFRQGLAGPGHQMEGYPVLVNGADDRKMEMPEMEMREKFVNYDKTEMPMENEEKMERAKEIMKKMRKCKHHHMEKGMMHRHHEHHHPEPREEMREEREEDGFIKQLLNFFNF